MTHKIKDGEQEAGIHQSACIPKPEGSQWTDEQWQAITARDQNILVSAAAGSGKTAVLVQRIIQRLLDPDHPIDVDRLLVVTFTNAAAAEMRSRIGEELERELKRCPQSLHLRRQLTLLNRASISTLHSFCMEILRRYYYVVDVDPGFRIADDTEVLLLRDEILEELFEERYSDSDNQHFIELVDRYSNDRTDVNLQVMISQLYDFSRSHPWPDQWLEEMAARYNIQEVEMLSDLPWTAELMEGMELDLQGALSLIDQALEVAQEPQGPSPYIPTLEEDRWHVEQLLQAREQSWEQLYEAFQSLHFSKLKRCKGDEFDPELQERVKMIRNQAKQKVIDLQSDYFSREPQEYIEDIQYMAPFMQTMVELVQSFAERYQQAKQAKGIVDFADLEHYGLHILRREDSTPEKTFPSSAALEYRQQFAEVLVDEYQDTNMVQEAIVQLVTTGEGEPGNLFMVGDVKQSIYRFRLAEPGLFLQKYRAFSKEIEHEDEPIQTGEMANDLRGRLPTQMPAQLPGGLRIDLSQNFRSREQILHAANFVFKQIMDEKVGEMEYDEDAQLVPGARFPTVDIDSAPSSTEVMLIDRNEETKRDEPEAATEMDHETDSAIAMESVQLEARLMAKKIKAYIGTDNSEPAQIYDKRLDQMRPVTYRDMVILLRATSNWAPVILEEFKQQGIPAYADLASGYFEAIEVEMMISLLKVIDNPYQDIPLAAVLRSPIVGLNGDELAHIRIRDRDSSYYEAFKTYIEAGKTRSAEVDSAHSRSEEEHASAINPLLVQKLERFNQQLQHWRTQARRGSLSDLIWQIYRETGYYDYVGGMTAGHQRKANLRALYDRARQYEQTSFRGLFRFLRFIERMQERGSDLGTARALGEQEDVVRLMTIHKSKGLEFPIVFVAGLSKPFNLRDTYGSFLLHKELGMGTKLVDTEARISSPTLPQLAIKQKMKMELLAEEMRILYVAFTRAREQLILVATVKDLPKQIEKWADHLTHPQWLLTADRRAGSRTYLDWIGPALLRHRSCQMLRDGLLDRGAIPDEMYDDPARWQVHVIASSELVGVRSPSRDEQHRLWEEVKNGQPVPIESEWKDEVDRRLSWKYPYAQAERQMSKQTVTEIKRQWEVMDEHSDRSLIGSFHSSITDHPRFLQDTQMSAAEVGTAMHMVMQHLDLKRAVTRSSIDEQIAQMVTRELLTEEQAEAIDAVAIERFYQNELGQEMIQAQWIKREVPFHLRLPAREVYTDWEESEEEHVLVQGIIDCIFEYEHQLILVDYKTDSITARFPGGFADAQSVLENRYRVQVGLYTRAVEQIWKRKVDATYLYFFDGGHILPMGRRKMDAYYSYR